MQDMPPQDERPTLPPPSLDELLHQAALARWDGQCDLEAHVTEYAARWRGALAREAGIGHFPQAGA